ncbi:hypothetical protein CO657_10305 [Rhizobium acidisoli]|uniref:Uncharacterized protein n=1 Tax=Rhizobium acidisoli TaxID=1538158 RepID=A0AAE5TVY3_9HYPH|nr:MULTISPECIES: hypothetical protein [Rhizobium]KPH08118.1 hypothetical protein AOG23_12650 [Rhizobium acidisoli]MBB5662719.1 hypothetical protein [Rhizobium leguminosarum]QAS78442.1 hypothetical protein CO657_10305 [Rhizobium acidisoli]
MQESRLTLNDNTAHDHIKPAKNEIKVIRHERLSYAHRCATFTDLNKEAPNDLGLAHPLSGEEQTAEERYAAAVPFAAKIVGFDAAEIGRSLCGIHRLTSMLAEIPSSGPGIPQLIASD